VGLKCTDNIGHIAHVAFYTARSLRRNYTRRNDKHRTNREQEFVIGGYIPGARAFDALLVGVYKNKQLMFVAKVNNGFVPRIRDEIFPVLKARQTAQCPFRNLPEKRASRWGESLTAEKMEQCRWVKPKLVCQVAFVEWTEAGHLRHYTFIAMRDDKILRRWFAELEESGLC
jgi:ATP-dependent DNA ligase